MGFSYVKNCLLTGIQAKPVIDSIAITEYDVELNGKTHRIKLSARFNGESDFIKNNRHVFYGLLYNDEWVENENEILDEQKLSEFISKKKFPSRPDEKLERLFLWLYKQQKEDGQELILGKHYPGNLWQILYFNSEKEMQYYLSVLNSRGLIKANFLEVSAGIFVTHSLHITFDGLNHAIKLNQDGENSNKCFIAMSFKPETQNIRLA